MVFENRPSVDKFLKQEVAGNETSKRKLRIEIVDALALPMKSVGVISK